MLSQYTHNPKRSTKSVGAAEIVAASDATDKEKMIKIAMSLLLCSSIQLLVALHKSDLFTPFSTQQNLVDKSMRADVNVIRYNFETQHVNKLVWIPGPVNLTDSGTNTDSPITQS